MRPRRRANGEAGRGAAGAAGQWRRGAGPALGGEGAESQWGEGAGRRRAPRRPPAGRAAAVRAPSAPRPRRSPSPGRPRLLCGFAAHGLHRVSGDAPPHRPRGRYRDSPPPHPPTPAPAAVTGGCLLHPPSPRPSLRSGGGWAGPGPGTSRVPRAGWDSRGRLLGGTGAPPPPRGRLPVASTARGRGFPPPPRPLPARPARPRARPDPAGATVPAG